MKVSKNLLLLSVLAYLASFTFGFFAGTGQMARGQQPSVATLMTNYTAESALVNSMKPAEFSSEKAQILGGAQRMTVGAASTADSASYSGHIMCKDHDIYFNPIEPTTIFRPSDTKAECLTTVTINDTIDFRWFYRDDSSRAWVSCYNWSSDALFSGEYCYAGYLLIAGHSLYYPRAYKVDVYLDNLFAFSEFFEITNGGLSSPRMCEAIDSNMNPINVKSRFTVGIDTVAYHYFRLENTAYFNEETNACHNFTTVWIQPDGNTYKKHSASFEDYKNTNANSSFWPHGFSTNDSIAINPSTPTGNWIVEVYLDGYCLNNTWAFYGPLAKTRFVVGSTPVADWTFMAYLDADMDGEAAGIDVFLNMANASLSPQTNVIVQMDRGGFDQRYGNWTDCKRFELAKDMTPTPENAVLDIGEVNMGDPLVLNDFANWTMSNYPADHYCLALWDHGAGFVGVCVDYTDGNDFLSLPELSRALGGLPSIIDVLFADVCSSAMAENAYQIKDCANVMVGPEGLGYAPGPYDKYLSSLNADTSATPQSFAVDIVFDYISWCNSAGDQIQNATMCAVDLTKISDMIEATEDFAADLKEAETFHHEQITLARNLTKEHVGPYSLQTGYEIDLYDFAQLTYQYVDDTDLQASATRLMTALSIGNVVLMEAGKTEPNSHGLSIFFPDEKSKYDQYEVPYTDLAFAKDVQWNESVEYHLSGCNLIVRIPYAEVGIEINNESLKTDSEGELQFFLISGPCSINVTDTFWTQPGCRGIFGEWDDGNSSNPRNILITPERKELKLTAYYITEYRLVMEANVGTTNPPLGEHWYSADSSVTISATPPNASPGERYVWMGWNGDPGTSNKTTVTIDGPINETAAWKHEYSLTTISNSSSTPTLEWHDAGALVNVSVASPVVAATGMRLVCNGWTGTGSIPANGTSTTAVFIMNYPSTINWNWTTQYLLPARTDPVGLPVPDMSPQGPWYDSGTSVNCTAQQVQGYVFDHWTVGGMSWDQGINPITLSVDASSEAIAHYTHARTWWDIALEPDNLRLIVAVLSVLITSASITTAWVKTRKRRSTMSLLLEEIDKIYLKLKTDPEKCIESLQQYEGTILAKMTEGKINESEHSILNKKISTYIKELQQQWNAKNKDE